MSLMARIACMHAQPLLAEMHALGANMGSSTDCLDVNADRDKSTRATSPVMCGHAPGNRGGAIFNTGVLWFAASEPAINFAKRWAAETLALTDPYSDDQVRVLPSISPLSFSLFHTHTHTHTHTLTL